MFHLSRCRPPPWDSPRQLPVMRPSFLISTEGRYVFSRRGRNSEFLGAFVGNHRYAPPFPPSLSAGARLPAPVSLLVHRSRREIPTRSCFWSHVGFVNRLPTFFWGLQEFGTFFLAPFCFFFFGLQIHTSSCRICPSPGSLLILSVHFFVSVLISHISDVAFNFFPVFYHTSHAQSRPPVVIPYTLALLMAFFGCVNIAGFFAFPTPWQR